MFSLIRNAHVDLLAWKGAESCRNQLNCLAGVEYLLCSDLLLLTPGQPGLQHPGGQEGLIGSLPTMESLTLEALPDPPNGDSGARWESWPKLAYLTGQHS